MKDPVFAFIVGVVFGVFLSFCVAVVVEHLSN